MKIVLSLGGSVFMPDLNACRIASYGESLKKLMAKHEFYVVVGGGRLKEYIKLAKELGLSDEDCDNIGIECTRLNARLLAFYLGTKFSTTVEGLSTGGVMGGTVPGHTTDAVGAMVAEHVGADIYIVATDVDGVYDKDPKRFRDAKRFDRVSGAQLQKLVGDRYVPGDKNVVDPIACGLISRMGIKTIVVNGLDFANIEKAIEGKKVGTLIVS